jgi:hypothetical protein
MSVAPAAWYRDPAAVLEAKQAAERTCRVCVYHLRRERQCLRRRPEYPAAGGDCPGFKSRARPTP